MSKIGGIELPKEYGCWELEDKSCEKMPQEIASALGVIFATRPEVIVPIYYYAAQLVNGTNHILVCKRSRTWDEETIEDYVRLEIHIPLGIDGYKKATLQKMEVSSETLLPKEPSEYFHAFFDYLVGVKITPLLYVGKKQVHGTNYIYICESRTVVPEAETELKRVEINVNGTEIKIVGIERLA